MTSEFPPAHHLVVPSGRTLVHLATVRAASVISVRVFAPGTRGRRLPRDPAAGVHQQQLRQPAQFASLLVGSNGLEANNLGTSQGAGGITPIAVNGRSFPYGSDSAVIQTGKGGGAICNRQWDQFNFQVPPITRRWAPAPTLTAGASGTGHGPNSSAGDTITVEVQYLGSPVHLLPGS